ncbi:MAG: hypothetical protein JRI96_07430 [Deltaproteobacteria bacterium]|nr:hypothetical protein [Deltaproteobacteria bacterium]
MDVGKSDILKVIESCGGKADFDTIKSKYEELPSHQSSHLWAHLRDLCEFGDIVEKSPKVYSLTEHGKERILKGNYSWEGYYDKKKKEDIEKAEWV